MKKRKIRAFVVNPYEITTDTGKVLVVDDEVVVGNVKDADESADGYERAFRAGWIVRDMMETRWDKERMEWTKTA